jgi:hypothetical protein
MKCMTHLGGLNEIDYRTKRISDEVELVLDSLDTMTRDNTDSVPGPQPLNIVNPLKRCNQSCRLYQTPNFINSHQGQPLPSYSGEKIMTLAKVRTKPLSFHGNRVSQSQAANLY